MYKGKGSLFRRLFVPLGIGFAIGCIVVPIFVISFSINTAKEEKEEQLKKCTGIIEDVTEGYESMYNMQMRKDLWDFMEAISEVYEVEVCYINPLDKKTLEEIDQLEKEATTPEEKEMAAMFSEMPKYHLFACRCQAKSDKIGSSESNCAHLDAFGLEVDFEKIEEYSSNQGVLREWIEAFIEDEEKKEVTKLSWSVPVFSTIEEETGELKGLREPKGRSEEATKNWAVFYAKKDKNAGGIIISTLSFEMDFYKPTFMIALITLISGVVMLYIVITGVVKMISNPMNQMKKATKRYAVGDFSERIPVEREDEVGELITAFNSMATALSMTENSRRAFVANVSHELKTPMTTIGGFVDGILDGTIPPEKQSYYLEIVSHEIKRLSNLVYRMLNLSKIEEGEVGLNLSSFNISKQLVDTLLTFEKQIEEKGIGITGLDTLDSIFVTADETMMYQVIYNLVENAVKFTPQNGRIDFRIEETATDLTIGIGNTGNGIPSEMLPRIFERFYKVDASRSYDKKGAGLGLYLVKTFIDLHNGKIDVSSTEGEYTQFRFSIPKNNDMNSRGEKNG